MMNHSSASTGHRISRLVFAVVVGWAFSPITSAGDGLQPLTGASDLSVGRSHACIVTAAGGVKCWGLNSDGQLGDGTQENSYVPVSVEGLTDAVSVSAGDEHTCAVTTSGGVKCWGQNFFGQLGHDSTAFRSLTPVDVVDLDGDVTMVVAGSGHTCSLDTDGQIRCWGYNRNGELGIGSQEDQSAPRLVSSNSQNVAISAGFGNTCLLRSDGSVFCWGVYDRECGFIGCGFGVFARPERVTALSSFDVIGITSGEYFHCALTQNNGVKCWGDNFDGELNDSGERDPDPFELFDIAGLESNVSEVRAGFDHGCARMNDGTVRCWGDNAFGSLGDGSNDYRLPALQTSGLSDVVKVDTGSSLSCALRTGGAVLCWGNNSSGSLGNNDRWFRQTPAPVPGLQSGVTAIAVGDFHSCALTQNGSMRCWGSNVSGQLGTGNFERARTPVSVTGATGPFANISAGPAHTCAVTAAGGAYCWGNNERGQLGNGGVENQTTPTPVQSLDSGVTQIEAGDFHTCARTATGAARCWGWNIDAQLGDASQMNQPTPVTVGNRAAGVAKVEAGGFFSCSMESAGTVSCWGSNTDGQLGNGTTDRGFLPEPVDIPFGIIASDISLGRDHACLLSTAGEALCWGETDNGRLGTQPMLPRNVYYAPTRVVGLLAGVVSISAGNWHTCAATNQGTALCWGSNILGQLGTGSFDGEIFATEVAEAPAGIVQVAAGNFHTCALTSGGAVYCWGTNSSDQLGLNRINHLVPGPVLDDPSFFRSSFEEGEGQ